jgi:nucleotide-binding universal stress UspA family protein
MILLATDFSRPARHILPYAVELAASLNLSLTVLHVVKAPPGSEEWSHAARRSLASQKTKALLALGRLVRFANEKGVTADYRLLVGIPEDSILKVAEDAKIKLIAVGTHGKTGWDRFRLGSVAEAIMRTAPCPVLTGRTSEVAPSAEKALRVKISRILVATDFSVSSNAALQFAVWLAKQLGAKIVLLHVAEPSGTSRSESVRTKEPFRRELDRLIQKAISASRADQIVSERIVLPGHPVEVILNQARRANAGLIVMGTKGRRGLKLLMLGSGASSVVRKASCPVLVVKAQATT